MNCTSCAIALDSRATFCPNCGATVPDPFLGQTIGDWTVEKRIAIGTFGSIYRAGNANGEQAAIKLMHRELANDERLVDRFRQEGSVMTQLSGPHIVRTFEFGETNGLPYITMELLSGETVLDRLRATRPLPWRTTLQIGRQVAEALAEAHAVGVIHRDLKPGNVFLAEPNDSVRVLDFGIAKILSNSTVADPKELTVMGTAVGTVEYMAPEQLMGGRADQRTDVYTLGVLMYEMIVGRRPFNAAGLALLTEQLSHPVPPPSEQGVNAPTVVDEVLLRCMAHDLDERFQNVRELQAAIDQALAFAETTPAAPPILPPPPLDSPTHQVKRIEPSVLRWPLLAIVAAVFAIALVVVAFLYA